MARATVGSTASLRAALSSLLLLGVVTLLSAPARAREAPLDLPLGQLRAPIVGGRPATAFERYATVAITNPHGDVICSGVAVAARVILTAAHCVTAARADRAGATALPADVFRVRERWASSTDAAPEATSDALEPVRVIPHPGYPGARALELGGDDWDEPYAHHDLAVLVLGEPVRELTPVALAAGHAIDDRAEPAPLVISGYGAREDGAPAAGLFIATTPLLELAETEFVAGDAGFPDTCSGDSGGPAYVLDDAGVALLGVVSRSRAQTPVCGVGGIYTFVPHYRDWILSVVDEAGPVACAAAPGPPRGAPRAGLLVACALLAARRRARNGAFHAETPSA